MNPSSKNANQHPWGSLDHSPCACHVYNDYRNYSTTSNSENKYGESSTVFNGPYYAYDGNMELIDDRSAGHHAGHDALCEQNSRCTPYGNPVFPSQQPPRYSADLLRPSHVPQRTESVQASFAFTHTTREAVSRRDISKPALVNYEHAKDIARTSSPIPFLPPVNNVKAPVPIPYARAAFSLPYLNSARAASSPLSFLHSARSPSPMSVRAASPIPHLNNAGTSSQYLGNAAARYSPVQDAIRRTPLSRYNQERLKLYVPRDLPSPIHASVPTLSASDEEDEVVYPRILNSNFAT